MVSPPPWTNSRKPEASDVSIWEGVAMWRHTVSATIVLLLSEGWTQGDGSNKKTIQDLRAAIKQLRALEKSEVKQIAARYDALIAKLKNPEHQLEEIRAELRTEEKTALTSAQTAEQKKQIRKEYADLIKILSGDIKADKNTIKQVEQQKKVAEKLLKAVFAAKIKELEDEIKLLEKKGGGKPKS
jgi:hypothetical protein